MRELRERLIDRWPPWLAGPDRRWVRPLLERCLRLAHLDRAQAFLEEHPQLRGLEFVEGALRHVDARYLVDDCEDHSGTLRLLQWSGQARCLAELPAMPLLAAA